MQRRRVPACAEGAVPRCHFCSGTEESPRLCFAAHLVVAPASSQTHALKQIELREAAALSVVYLDL